MHRVDYIGWCGYGNAGDEACLEVVRRWLPGYAVEPTDNPRAPLCLLGGGTLAGLPQYGRPARLAVDRGAALAICGTGFDLTDPLATWSCERRELWAGLLSQARLVGVRGPHSRDVAEALGVPAEILGDPALAMGEAPAGPPKEFDLVLINAGSELDPPGGRGRLLGLLGRLVGRLRRRHVQCEYLPLRETDLAAAGPLLERNDLPAVPCDLPTILQRVSEARLVVSLRLHGAVFAAAAGVPFLSIGYHPKHRDFCDSLGWPVFASRTLRVAELLAMVGQIDQHAAAVRGELGRHVACYRARLDQFGNRLLALANEVYQ